MHTPMPDPTEPLRAEIQQLRAQIATLEAQATAHVPGSTVEPAGPPIWFDSVSDAIFIADPSWIIQHWNQAATELYGWRPGEAVGRPIRDLIAVARYLDSSGNAEAIQALLTTGSWRGTMLQHTRDGREVVVEGATRTLTNAQGTITGYIGINRDITARVQAEQKLQRALERLQILADASHAFAQATMNEPELLHRIARLTAEPLTATCAIWLSSADARWLQLGAIADRDPEVKAFLDTIAAQMQISLDTSHPAAVVTSSGHPLLIPVIDPEALRTQVAPELWAAFERVHPHSFIIVRLQAHGATFGCLVFIRHDPGQPAFTTDDLTLAQDLADRAALALLNTRLYQQALSAQQTATESLARLDALITSVPSGIGYLDRELRYQLVNPALAAINHGTPADHLGRTPHELIPGLAPRLEPIMRQVLDTGEAVRDLELHGQFCTTIGGAHDWLISYFPVRGSDNVVTGVGVTITDITVSKRTAAALHTLEQKLGALFALLPVGISILDATGAIAYVNPALVQMTQLDPATLRTEAPQQLRYIRPDGTPRPAAELAGARAFREQRPVTDVESGIVTEAGAVTWVSASAVPLDFPDWRVVIVTTDITQRTQAEDARRASEARYRVLFETMAQGVIVYNPSGQDIMMNPAAEHILGHPHADLRGGFAAHPDWSVIHEDGTPLTRERHPVRVALQTKQELRNLVLGVIPPDGGATRWLRVQVVPQCRAGTTTVEQIYAIFEDITAQRAAQHALEQERQQLVTILNTMQEGVIAARPDGTLALINPAALQVSDLDPTSPPAVVRDLIPTPRLFLDSHGETIAPDDLPLQRVLQSERVVGLELCQRTLSDGTEHWHLINGTPAYDADGQLRLGVITFQDITDRKRAEAELRESEAQLRLALDAAELGIWRLDDASGVVTLDVRAQAHFGVIDAIIPREALAACVHPEDRARLQHEAQELRLSSYAGQMHTEYRVIHPDGSIHWLARHARYRFRDVGTERTIIGAYGATQDITARKGAEEALHAAYRQVAAQAARLESLLAYAPIGISLLDTELRFQHINAQLAAMNGLPPEAQLGRTIQEVLPALAPTLEDIYRQVLATGIPLLDREIVGETPAAPGVIRTWQASYFPVRKADGPLVGVGVVAIDITERKQAELALAAHAETVSRTNAELIRALQLKDEFLAMMSHELRTPLNVMLSYSEGVAEEVYGPLSDRQRDALGRVTTSGQHLLAILNDILDLAYLEGGRATLETARIPIDHLCRAAMQLVAGKAQQKGIKLSRTVAVGVEAVQADVRRLTQILVNLLDNAIKFTPAGGKVGLEVIADIAREQIALTVWDTGIGIAEADYARLFQPFTQVDGRLSRSYEGIGLGLSLVRRLVDLHGGSIQLTSTPGQGSRFTVRLPWSEEQNVPPSPKQMTTDQSPVWATPPRLVIADDHEATLTFYRDWLSETGCAVAVARTGTEAVAQVRATRPDVAILDIQMPELDGLTAIRQIRADPLVGATPIIALTALAMPGDRERCMEAGANIYLAKPISVHALMKAIAEARTGKAS